MSSETKIVVVYGGTSAEREVSLASGAAAIAEALAPRFRWSGCLDADALPTELSSDCVVFPALHGTFGEDGGFQALLEAAGIEYCGSGPEASRLCMNKVDTKRVARELGVPTPESLTFDGRDVPLADDVIAQLGASLVVKPADQGSSVGLHFAEHRSALGIALSQIHSVAGSWSSG